MKQPLLLSYFVSHEVVIGKKCGYFDGEWTEVTSSPTQITLTRVSDTEATLAVAQSLDVYKFFKVVVK